MTGQERWWNEQCGEFEESNWQLRLDVFQSKAKSDENTEMLEHKCRLLVQSELRAEGNSVKL